MKYYEDGSTRSSVKNAKGILVDRGVPDSIKLWYDPRNWYRVEAEWKKPAHKHAFEGFAWGYGGEGPVGLQVFLNAVGMPLKIEEIASWPENFGAHPMPKSWTGPREWSPIVNQGTKVFHKGVHYGKDWV